MYIFLLNKQLIILLQKEMPKLLLSAQDRSLKIALKELDANSRNRGEHRLVT